jgi:hypothetical protein
MTGSYVKYGRFYHKEKIYHLSAMRGSSCDNLRYSYLSNHINRSEINDGSQTSHHVNQHFQIWDCLWLTEISVVTFNHLICCVSQKCNSSALQLELILRPVFWTPCLIKTNKIHFSSCSSSRGSYCMYRILYSGLSSPLCFYANEGWWVRQNTTVLWLCFIGLTMSTCFGRAWPSSGHKLLYN